MSKLEESDAEEESKDDKEGDGDGKKKKGGKYKPSRNVPQFFQDEKDSTNVSIFCLIYASFFNKAPPSLPLAPAEGTKLDCDEFK